LALGGVCFDRAIAGAGSQRRCADAIDEAGHVGLELELMAIADIARPNEYQALEAIYQDAIAGTIRPDRRKSERNPCTAMVWVAVVEDRFPTREDLQLAMCRDVSLDGISFYFRQMAHGQRVVLSLTRTTEVLLQARVVSSRAVDATRSSPEHPFVIHCEFLGRLLPDRFA
jgi:hypothetical protein